MIKSRFTFKQLEAFAFVVDTGTFRGAAAALGTTQPNISTRIAALEATLGATLLYRDAGSVRLTAQGAEMLDQTREILRAGEALLEQAGRHDLVEERLRLGVTELVACTWLQAYLRRMKQTYPNLRIELQVDLSTRIEERLVDGQLDLALQTGPFVTDLSGSIPLGIEAYIWVAAPELAARIGPAPKLRHLFAGPVLTHAKHTQAGMALHAKAAETGLDTTQIVHSSALSVCVPMVCEGLGVATLPRALVADDIALGRLVALDADWVPAPLAFYARYRAEQAPRFVTKAATLAAEASTAASNAELP